MAKLFAVGLALVVVIAAALLLFKLISGAIGLIGGFLNVVLAVVIIAATLVIIVWMFRFASKHRK